MTWFTVDTPDDEERLTAGWSDAPVENSELVSMLLDIARIQVMAFAADDDEPALQVADLLAALDVTPVVITAVLALLAFDADPAPPSRYIYAQLQQAKNLWNAGRTSGDGNVGTEGFSFQPRPLDKTIRGVIRPTSGTADVF